jgi:hypothetical protein
MLLKSYPFITLLFRRSGPGRWRDPENIWDRAIVPIIIGIDFLFLLHQGKGKDKQLPSQSFPNTISQTRLLKIPSR